MQGRNRVRPVFAAVERSDGLTWERHATLQSPLAAIGALLAASFIFRLSTSGESLPSGGGVILILLSSIVIAIVIVASMAGTHRTSLTAEYVGGLGCFGLDGATWRYISYIIGFVVLFAIAISIVGGAAIAIANSKVSLAGAWAATRGNTLFAGTLLAHLPLWAISAFAALVRVHFGIIGDLIRARYRWIERGCSMARLRELFIAGA